MAQRLAEENADAQVALAVTANMAAQVADAAVVQANADLIVAQDMQKQAEDDRDAALADEGRGSTSARVGSGGDRDLAEQQAERSRARSRIGLLEEDAEEARQELIQATGTGKCSMDAPGTPQPGPRSDAGHGKLQ